MLRLLLFRQRQIWMPTLIGWISIVFIIAIIGLLLVRNLYDLLALNEPVGANILVVEGWLAPEELDQAIAIYKHGRYDHIVTTGGPLSAWSKYYLHSNYAMLAADYLISHGISQDKITKVPTPASAQERTFLSAVVLRNLSRELGWKIDTFDIISSGAHARRSRLLFQMAFGKDVKIGVIAARPADFNPEKWWSSSGGVESLIFQTIAIIWVKCCFWPGAPGTQQELWGAS